MFHQLRDQLFQQLTGQPYFYCQQQAQDSSGDPNEQPTKKGYFEKRRQSKEAYQQRVNREQDLFTRDAFKKLQGLVKTQESDMQEAIEGRQKLKEVYQSKKELARYRDNLLQRQQRIATSGIANEIYYYCCNFLYPYTDDEIVYAYKRKMQKKIQQTLLQSSIIPLLIGAFFYGVTRRLKRYRPSDPLYFLVPFCLAEYATLKVQSKVLYELEYPAHPVVSAKRSELINRICYSYPKILKIEIEFLHRKLVQRDKKIFQENQEKMEQNGEKNKTIEREPLHFEKVFTLGQVGKDYRKILNKKEKGEKQEQNKEQQAASGARFKLIVEEGELFLQCVDKFEEVFEISQDAVQGVSVTDCLDPIVIKNHQEIVNAMFEFYYLLQTEYLSQYYYENEPHKDLNHDAIFNHSSLEAQAERKLRKELELTPEDQKRRREAKRVKDPLNSTQNTGSLLGEIFEDEGDKHSRKRR